MMAVQMADMMSTAIAVIPVYNPEPGLVCLCLSLAKRYQVLVVDDGSRERVGDFEKLPSQVRLIRHGDNRGKGRAIKTAIEWIRANMPAVKAVVFVDGDGQHRPEDVDAVVTRCLESGDTVLGVRDFHKTDIPFRSRFGNVLTSWLVRRLFGLRIYDTQTGLRAIPSRLFEMMLELPGERYEYEMRLFGALKRRGETLLQVPIKTIYMEGNRASHFNPIRDSARIYRSLFGDAVSGEMAKQLFLFVLSSVSSFGLDVAAFCWFYDFILGANATGRLLWSVVVARIISLAYNFLLNRYVVFKKAAVSRVPLARSFGRYLILAILIMMASYLLTSLMLTVCMTPKVAWVKVAVDLGLFIISYLVQRKCVFARSPCGRAFA